MSMTRTIGVLLIAAGALGLIYGGFVVPAHDREAVYVPIAVGAAAIALGLFFVFGLRSK